LGEKHRETEELSKTKKKKKKKTKTGNKKEKKNGLREISLKKQQRRSTHAAPGSC